MILSFSIEITYTLAHLCYKCLIKLIIQTGPKHIMEITLNSIGIIKIITNNLQNNLTWVTRQKTKQREENEHTEANAEANAELRVAEHLVQSQGTQNKSLPVSSATINFTPGVPNSIVV